MTLRSIDETLPEQGAIGVLAVGTLILVYLVMGCRSAPVERIDCEPFTVRQGVTLEDLDTAFLRGLHELRWRALDDGRRPGRIQARRTWHSNSSIEVSVEYDLRCLSIRHIRSTGNYRFSEGEQTVHRTYNRTVRTLAQRLASKAATVLHFDLAEHEKYRGEGTGSLEGQAFLRQQGGGVVTCAPVRS